MPDRQSQGLRFFSVSRAMTLRRRMKSTLSNTCKQLQASIDKLGREEEREGREEERETMRTFLPACLKLASFPDYSHFLTLDYFQVLITCNFQNPHFEAHLDLESLLQLCCL